MKHKIRLEGVFFDPSKSGYGTYFSENMMEWGYVTSNEFSKQIEMAGDNKDIDVYIKSPGGSLIEGFTIYNHMERLKKEGYTFRTIADGLVGSVATIVFLGGSERIMQEGTEFFIHNPWASASGDAEAFAKYSKELAEAENEIAEFYAKKTGLEFSKVKDLMKESTTLRAEETLELGFSTSNDEPLKMVAFLDLANLEKFTKLGSIQKVIEENEKKEDQPEPDYTGLLNSLQSLKNKL